MFQRKLGQCARKVREKAFTCALLQYLNLIVARMESSISRHVYVCLALYPKPDKDDLQSAIKNISEEKCEEENEKLCLHLRNEKITETKEIKRLQYRNTVL